MGNISTIQSAVNQAFRTLGDLVGSFTLNRVTLTFDPLTSDTTSVSTTFVGEGVFDNDKSKMASLTVLTKDQTRIWLKITTEPLLSDTLTFPDGSVRSIVEVRPVRANTTVFIYEVICGP